MVALIRAASGAAWGYPIVRDEPVPRNLEKHAKRAVAACPALALRLERVAKLSRA